MAKYTILKHGYKLRRPFTKLSAAIRKLKDRTDLEKYQVLIESDNGRSKLVTAVQFLNYNSWNSPTTGE